MNEQENPEDQYSIEKISGRMMRLNKVVHPISQNLFLFVTEKNEKTMRSPASVTLLFSILFRFGYSEGCYKQLLLRFWTGIDDKRNLTNCQKLLVFYLCPFVCFKLLISKEKTIQTIIELFKRSKN